MRPEIEIMLRRRSDPHQPIEDVHDQIMEGLCALGLPWWQPDAHPPAPDCGADLAAYLDVSYALEAFEPDVLRATIDYVYRSAEYDEDHATLDDRMLFQLDAASASDATYRELALVGFPGYVRAFSPYRGHVMTDAELAIHEWRETSEISREIGKRVTGRDNVWRIEPVSYFDRELCRRAFSLAPEDITSRLSGNIERVEMIGDGVLIVATSAIVDRDELLAIDARIRGWLGVPHPRELL